MLRLEWKNLFKNKILLIVIAAVVAIPMIYTTLFLGSMWDPYGNTDKLPVAVINHDRSVTYEDTTLCVGDELIKELKNNSSLKFCFPSEKDAEQGLKDGTYYMVITIPEDFSADAATVTESSPQKMVLNYETNPGTNYIASKMSETAMKQLNLSVRNEVTETYARVMFDKIREAGEGMSEASAGSGELKDGVLKVQEGNNAITENLRLLAESSLTFTDGSSTLTEGLKQYTAGVNGAADGACKINSGTEQLHNGILELSDKFPELASGAAKLNDGASAVFSGLSSAQSGSTVLSSGAADVDEHMKSLNQGLSALADASGSLPELTDSLNKGADSLSEGAAILKKGVDTLSAEAYTLQDSTEQLASGLSSIAGSSHSQSDALCSKAEDLSRAIQNAADAGADPDSLAHLKVQADLLIKDLRSYTDGVNASADRSAELSKNIPALLTGIDNLSQGLDNLDSGISRVKAGTSSLAEQAPELAGNISGASEAARQIQTQGTAVLKKGAADLDTGISALNSGAKELSQGTANLTGRIPALTDGLLQLQSGTSQLRSGTSALMEGTSSLVQNNDSLLNGSGQLTSGASQISDGASQLADGSRELEKGMTQIYSGTETLEDELEKGAEQIAAVNTSGNSAEMFSSPVTAKETQITDVADNGHAMAPYMMSVGLWVGCIAFSLMYPLTSYSGKMKSGVKWWLSKASVLYLISVLQAVVMITALHIFNGFNPVHMGKTLLTACIASLAFMSVMYFFTSLLGRIGSFLMLVFMVIQLAGSAGTYPLEISGEFVPHLHSWVPFTYTVNAFRSTISGGESISGCLLFLLVLFAVFTLFTILEFQIRAKKIRKGRNTWSVWLEEHGLA